MIATNTESRTEVRRFSAKEAAGGTTGQLQRVPRLPAILRTAAERMGASLTTLCRGAAVSLVGCTEGRLDDYLPGDVAGVDVVELSAGPKTAFGYIAVDRRASHELCDRALGGRGDVPAGPLPAAVGVEARFSGLMFGILTESLAEALRSAAPEMTLQWTEMKIADLAKLAFERPMIFAAAIELEIARQPRRATVILRQSAVAAMRDLLREPQPEEAPGPSRSLDPQWLTGLAREVARAEVGIRAILEEREMTLSEIAGWRPGVLVRLDATARSLVVIESEGIPLFRCELGRQGETLILSLHSAVEPDADLLTSLAAGRQS